MAVIMFYPVSQFEESDSLTGTFEFQSSVIRANSGPFSLRTNPTAANTTIGRLSGLLSTGINGVFGAAGSLWTTFYFRVATAPSVAAENFAQWVNGTTTNKIQLRLRTDRKIEVRDTIATVVATSTTALDLNKWYRIGWRTSGTGGEYALWIAEEGTAFGSPELSGTADQGGTNLDRLRLGRMSTNGSQNCDWFFQDVVIDNERVWNDFRSVIALPKAEGAQTGWTGSWQDVDELPNDGDTTYLVSSVNPSSRTVICQTFAEAGGLATDTIHAVQGFSVKRRGGAATANQAIRFDRNGVDYGSGTTNLAATYTKQQRFHATDPADGHQWTAAKFNATEVGCRLISAAEARATNMHLWALVTAEPAITGLELRGTSSFKQGATATAISGVPAGTASGNLLLMGLFIRGTQPRITPTTPTGWTLIDSILDPTSAHGDIYLYWRIADATATDSPEIALSATPSDGWHVRTMRFVGHDATTPIQGTAKANRNGSSETAEIPVLTVDRNGSIAFCEASQNHSADATFTWPGSWTMLWDDYNAGGFRSNNTGGWRAVNAGSMASGQNISGFPAAATDTIQIITAIIQPPGAATSKFLRQRSGILGSGLR